ncbi:mitochondrial carrier domain-containing protein [Gorgonomyces haynaldii]|nr:mitochondrial carrier domain-containing protein [Gorgonomyces haynaldii]
MNSCMTHAFHLFFFMSPPTGKRNESATARIIGSASSGILELLVFHPVDTVAKRLMNNQTQKSLNEVIFRDAASQSVFKKWMSLFPGLGAAAGYKILQRVYKFGGQPFVNDYFNKNHKETFRSLFGDRHSKTIMHATAGSLIGIGEVVLLPLDAMKIKMQTNAHQYAGKSFFQIMSQEGFGLYRGATWTMARNAPGSFALFGGSAFAKEYIFKLEDYSKATFFHNFVASISGAVASITISAPLDVIKTRIQAKSASQAEAGWTIVRNMIVKEGFGSFFKGLTPKILVVGPKLVFSFTIAQQMIPWVDKLLK